MSAYLLNFSRLHNYDFISVPNGRQSMGYYYGGNVAAEFQPDFVNSSLHFTFIGFIQSRSSFVQ
jgi:hypothetical protein